LSVNCFLVRGSGLLDDIKLWSTSPDSDADSITDLDELNVHGTDPLNVDTDEDSLPDGVEVGTYFTLPTAVDTDNDGLADGEELAYWKADWAADADGDGLVNLVDSDSDNDGIADGIEVAKRHNPADAADSPARVYEDAQDGTTSGWDIYDGEPYEASIENVDDADLNSKVIELTGNGSIHGFRLRKDDLTNWANTGQFVLHFMLKYSEHYYIYVDVETSAGHRYLKYTPSDYNDLGSGEYVHHGLGWHTRNGQWHTIERDLAADLAAAQPGTELVEVNAILIRGSGRLDNISLRRR
jgi:hypothetical protein